MLDFVGIDFENLINWSSVLKHSTLIFIALMLSLPIAYNREAFSNGAGLRTYSLVAVATCSYTLLALEVLSGSDGIGKFMAGIVTGIGFIGGGAIMKSKDDAEVNGLADAASIWNMGAMGMAVAWQRFEIAILITMINYAIFRVGHKVKKEVENSKGKE